MLTHRPASERGRTGLDWLDGRHTFSFGEYVDPAHHHFRSLRVINEDRVAPGGGFDTHGHRDMEILTWILQGELRHRDSLGHGTAIRPGELQRMTAGTGVLHSEHNASHSEPVHLLQIWLLPERKGLAPSYEQRAFDPAGRRGCLQLLASRDGRDGLLTIHQDADVWCAELDGAERASLPLRAGRGAWVQVARGKVALNGRRLAAGDGAALEDEAGVELSEGREAEVLVFDLA
jgi:redox-sensitive bicupin YhaK (pirin superfamily)